MYIYRFIVWSRTHRVQGSTCSGAVEAGGAGRAERVGGARRACRGTGMRHTWRAPHRQAMAACLSPEWGGPAVQQEGAWCSTRTGCFTCRAVGAWGARRPDARGRGGRRCRKAARNAVSPFLFLWSGASGSWNLWPMNAPDHG